MPSAGESTACSSSTDASRTRFSIEMLTNEGIGTMFTEGLPTPTVGRRTVMQPDIQALDRQYIAGTYRRFPAVLGHGKGSPV